MRCHLAWNVWSLGVVLTAATMMQPLRSEAADAPFRAGAFAKDITPKEFPVLVNGNFLEVSATKALDSLYARAIVLDDGKSKLAICVVDSCMIPRPVIDAAKKIAAEKTGIPAERMLVSATHTHTAPSVMDDCLGARADEKYRQQLPTMVAEAIVEANSRLQPAQIGWTSVEASEHTNCRRWIRRPDRVDVDPFGEKSVLAMMHPGYQNPDYIGPAGPVDTGLSLVSVQTPTGRPVALLANYSMHYFGTAPLSADYFGKFASQIGGKIGAGEDFVGIMSQGTSGDLHWMNYAKPKRDLSIQAYTEGLMDVAFGAYRSIKYHSVAPLAMAQTTLTLQRRTPDENRLAWAKKTLAAVKGPRPTTRPEIYARQAIVLHENPTSELVLQVVRIGDLAITALPNEVFGITGLKLKLQSPLPSTFNIELANGAEGYIPPPEQHEFGGYTTWPATTAALEVQAEPKIVESLLGLLESLVKQPRRKLEAPIGSYLKAVLASKPLTYWRMNEIEGRNAADATGRGNNAKLVGKVAMFLDGPDSQAFGGPGDKNRAFHFGDGRMTASAKGLEDAYSVEFWVWNGLPSDARGVTATLFSLGNDRLTIGGTNAGAGKLVFESREMSNPGIVGLVDVGMKSWRHVAIVRNRADVAVYLDGKLEIKTSAPDKLAASSSLHFAGREDGQFGLAGKLDEVAVYDRPLTAKEVAAHFAAGQVNP